MTKSELRRLYKQKRAALSDHDSEQFSVQIFNNFKERFNLHGKQISIFLPIKRLKEINTWHFLNGYEANYYLPVVKTDKLVHIKYETQNQLEESEWGIPEPTYGQEASPHLFDAVLIPLLAYDYKGNRIGYGKGFYDSFIKDCREDCQLIGLSFFEPEPQKIEIIPSDIPIQYCVTPKKIHDFSQIQ